MTFDPKLIATDLDGTLLRTDGTVSERNRAALAAVRARGVPVVAVTGRGPRLLDMVRRDMGSTGLAVLAQGGYVVDLATGEELSVSSLPAAVAAKAVQLIEDAVGELIIAVEEVGDLTGPLRVQNGFDWPYPDPAVLLHRAEVLRGDALKVFVRSPAYGQDSLLALALAVLPLDLVEVTHAGLGFIEICPPGVTKATGLAVAAARHGVDAAGVLCFGDMPNDLSMFAWAGHAVAVASAHPTVLAAADALTLSNDEDGVAAYLDALFASAREPS
ncbi:MAG: HAD family phosphatase [Geodermatophilaceae bacterium]|nr:HAD family phosphatase [Geodermatophilaceae bacterium]MDQ3466270.1 Cof-type HAD-IIB family hydrolase [Actinomycetota bacterium]